jgi:hypothetical protein
MDMSMTAMKKIAQMGVYMKMQLKMEVLKS